jgi:hypothetical protein
MTTLEWLLAGDPTLARLVRVHLLDEPLPPTHEGLIEAYFHRFDPLTNRFGQGIYSPKWISTHYTLLELIDLEVDPAHPIVFASIKTLLDGLWHPPIKRTQRWLDLCVAAMLVRMATYASVDDPRVADMLTYILDHVMPDGGYNCEWDRGAIHSSVHTTMSAIDAFDELVKHPARGDVRQIETARRNAEAFLLKKRLAIQERTGELMHPAMAEYHYPPRWKYDVLHALLHFALTGHPETAEMTPWIDDLVSRFTDGTLPKGPKIGGLTHFPLEPGRGRGRFTTLRGLIVLKAYRPDDYHRLLHYPMKG